jgi:hypothetical protein
MSTVSAIFERLGGPAKVGRVIGKSTEHATIMRRRGSIPVRYWPALMAVRPKGGKITYADLVAAHARPAPSVASSLPQVVSPAGA